MFRGTYRWIPLEPDTLTRDLSFNLSKTAFTKKATSHDLTMFASSPGSRSKTTMVGTFTLGTLARNGWISRLAIFADLDQGGQIVDQNVVDYRFFTVPRDGIGLDPIGCERWGIFFVKILAIDSIRESLHRDRTVFQMGETMWGT